MVKPEFSKVGTELEMDILDEKHFELEEKTRTVNLTDPGIEYLETVLRDNKLMENKVVKCNKINISNSNATMCKLLKMNF